MRNFISIAMVFLLVQSCGSAEDWTESAVLRAAEGTPTLGHPQGVEPREDFCENPVIDTENEIRLLLIRSHRGIADYEVPSGMYGLRPGELLRIDCGTGEVLGIVRM